MCFRKCVGLRRQLVAGAVLSAIWLPALANYQCTGTINAVTVDPFGTVVVGSHSSGLAWVQLCRTGTTINGVGPDECKTILAALLAAQTTDSQVEFWFNDSLSCTTHPQWGWLTGWYFGPSVLKN